MVRNINQPGRRSAADGLDQVENQAPVFAVQPLAGFIQNQKNRGFYHGPRNQDEPLFAV